MKTKSLLQLDGLLGLVFFTLIIISIVTTLFEQEFISLITLLGACVLGIIRIILFFYTIWICE